MITRTAIRPEWLAARYGLRLPVARAVVRDHSLRQWRRYGWLAPPTAALWLTSVAGDFGWVTLPRGWGGLMVVAALALLGLHLWLAQRAARMTILVEAERLARDPIARRRE